jgi:hypothetical protein
MSKNVQSSNAKWRPKHSKTGLKMCPENGYSKTGQSGFQMLTVVPSLRLGEPTFLIFNYNIQYGNDIFGFQGTKKDECHVDVCLKCTNRLCRVHVINGENMCITYTKLCLSLLHTYRLTNSEQYLLFIFAQIPSHVGSGG